MVLNFAHKLTHQVQARFHTHHFTLLWSRSNIQQFLIMTTVNFHSGSDMQFARPLWLMNPYCWNRGVPRFPIVFKFWTKSECSNWLKFWFQQPFTGCFKQTNGNSHAPTPRVMASRPVKFSSYILLLFPKDLLFCTLINFISFPHLLLSGH